MPTRTLRKQPAFTLAAVLTLALGIGANVGIFTLFDQVLIRSLPVREPERLVQLAWRGQRGRRESTAAAACSRIPFCRDLEEQTEIFDGMLCRHPTDVNFSTGREHEPVRAEIVSGAYFDVLGVRPHLGRLIAPADDRQPGAHPVVVLSHAFWATRLAGATRHRWSTRAHQQPPDDGHRRGALVIPRRRSGGSASRVDPVDDETARDARMGRPVLETHVLGARDRPSARPE